MSIGSALQAAVNGYVDGKNIRNGWDDRKTQNKRQARMDELRENAEVRTQQAHEMDLETGELLNTARRQGIRQTDQDWSDGQELRGALSAADEAAMAGMGAIRQPAGAAAPALVQPAVVSTSGGADLGDRLVAVQDAATLPARSIARGPTNQPPAPGYSPPQIAQPQMEGGSGVSVAADPAPMSESEAEIIRAATQPARDTARGPANMPALGAVQPRRQADLLRLRPDGKLVANRPPATDEERRMLLEAAKAGKLATNDESAARQDRIDAKAALGLPYEWGRAGAAGEDISRAGGIAKEAVKEAGLSAAEYAGNVGTAAFNGMTAIPRAVDRWVSGENEYNTPAPRMDLDGDGRGRTPLTPVAESLGAIRAQDKPAPAAPTAPKHAPAAAGDAAPESAKAASDSAARVMDEVTKTSSMKAATEAMPAAALGVSKSTPTTKTQRQKAGASYMQSYRENGAPLVIRALMKQGRLEQAQQFETWVKDSRVEEGMQAWGRGMFAALQGDIDSAADAFMEAYNASGYFDDGMEVVKDKSRVIRDEATGEVAGVTLTLRDLATGEEITQTDSIDRFIEKAGWITSPEKAFEASQARLQAQQQALLKADEERRASATKLIEQNFGKTVDLARDMFAKSQSAAQDAAMTGETGNIPEPMTWDEAFREAQRIMVEGPAAAPANAPPGVNIARRPQ